MNCDKCQSCQHQYKQREGLPPIVSLFLGLTEDCTHRCKYCFVHHNPAEMTYETAYEGMMWLSKQTEGNITINYFGGEPLLKWDIIKPLTTEGRRQFGTRISFNITTNGYLLDEEKIQFLKEYHIPPLLSFDGIKECQDINRPLRNNKGSFDGTYKNIKPLLEVFPYTTFRMTVYNKTVKYFYANHLFAVDNGFQNTYAAVDTFGEWTEEEYSTLESEMFRVADLFILLIKQGRLIRFNPLLKSINKLRMLDGEVPSRKIQKPNTGKCGIGSNQSVVLAPDGTFYTCQEVFTNELVRDYFKVGDIKNGIDKDRRLAIIDDLDPDKFRCSNPDTCNACGIKTVCDGGCSARNYEQFQDINIIPEPLCRDENIRLKVMRYIDEQLKGNELYLSKVRIAGQKPGR